MHKERIPSLSIILFCLLYHTYPLVVIADPPTSCSYGANLIRYGTFGNAKELDTIFVASSPNTYFADSATAGFCTQMNYDPGTPGVDEYSILTSTKDINLSILTYPVYDQSGDTTDFMIFFNTDQTGIFYTEKQPICSQATYILSFDVINAVDTSYAPFGTNLFMGAQPMLPSLGVFVNGKNISNTGMILNDGQWTTVCDTFFVEEADSIEIQLENYTLGSFGNNFIIDNLDLRRCTNREKVHVPTAFTPNGDSVNDFLEVFGLEFVDFEMLVFNNWGEVIYKSTSRDDPWDGSYKGKAMPSGVYPWALKYTNCAGERKEHAGVSRLIR